MNSSRLSLLAVLLLVACGATEQQETPAATPVPVSTIWKWQGVEGGQPSRIDHPGRYTLEFLADGRYSVRADCNSGTGSWEQKDGQLRLAAGALTMVACPESSHADRFLTLLSTADSLRTANDTLELRIAQSDQWMRFVAMPELVPAGTTWLVRAFNRGNHAVTSVNPGTELTLTFGTEGDLSGSGGCNQLRASFEVEGNTMSIGPVASTRMMCMGEGVSEQEDEFLKALASVSTWEIRGGRAQLRDAAGALAIDLVAAVTGEIRHHTRQAVPPEAVIAVQLLDVSRADAPAIELAQQTFPADGKQSPWPFELQYDPTEIQPNHVYALRATVRLPDRLLMTTTESVRVLTSDSPHFGVELILHPAGE